MESSGNWLSGGFHAAADVVIATVAGVLAVTICCPLNKVAAVVKIPLRLIKRSREGIVRLSTDSRAAVLTQDRISHKS
jgi:hypothetical protein